MSIEIVAANVLGTVAVMGGIVLCVRYDQAGKNRRRELEHVERLKSIELGRDLDDAAIARTQALGAIGVAVPISSLCAAAIGSAFAMLVDGPGWRFGTFAVIWIVCGLVCVVIVPIVLTRLKESRRIPFKLPDQKPESQG